VPKNQSDYLRRLVWISKNIGWSFQKCSSDGEQCNSIIDKGVLSKFRKGISCNLVAIATRRAFHRARRSEAPGSVRSKQRTFSSRPHSKYDYREDVRAAELNPSPEFLFLVFLLPWVRSFQRDRQTEIERSNILQNPLLAASDGTFRPASEPADMCCRVLYGYILIRQDSSTFMLIRQHSCSLACRVSKPTLFR